MLTYSMLGYGFFPIQQHIRYRLNSSGKYKSTNPQWLLNCYYKLTNISFDHSYKSIFINQGLEAAYDYLVGLLVLYKE